MPEPREGAVRKIGGQWQVYFEGQWNAIDAEQSALLEANRGRPGQTGSVGIALDGDKFPPRPPVDDNDAIYGPKPPIYPGDWPITKEREATGALRGLVPGPREPDWDAMEKWKERARAQGWQLNEAGIKWVKAPQKFPDNSFATKEEVQALIDQAGLTDSWEVIPDKRHLGRFTFREKETPKPQPLVEPEYRTDAKGNTWVRTGPGDDWKPAPKGTVAGLAGPEFFTDAQGREWVRTEPNGEWQLSPKPPVTKETVATSIEQLITQALQAEDWDKAIAIRDFRDAPTDAQKFQLALQFAGSDVDFETFKTAFEFFNGAGAAAGLGGLGGPAAKAPFGFFPGGQPITQADLTMGQRLVPQFPQLPGGPQFPLPSTPTTGGQFGQPANVEADLQKELDALTQKLQAAEAQTGPDLTPEEVERIREIPRILAASKGAPPQFPTGAVAAAQAAQDRALINKFQPYNFGKVRIGDKEFSIETPVARWWLTLTPEAQQTMLKAGFAPDESFVPPPNKFGASSVPPITAFAPGKNGGPPVSAHPQDIGGGQFGTIQRFNTPEEQLLLAKATQASVAAGQFGPAGLASFDTRDWEDFRRQVSAAQSAGTVESLPFSDFAGYRKFKGLGPEPHELLQQQQQGQFNIEKLRNLRRPSKKQFTPRTRIFA